LDLGLGFKIATIAARRSSGKSGQASITRCKSVGKCAAFCAVTSLVLHFPNVFEGGIRLLSGVMNVNHYHPITSHQRPINQSALSYWDKFGWTVSGVYGVNAATIVQSGERECIMLWHRKPANFIDFALPTGTIVQPIQCAYLAFLRVT